MALRLAAGFLDREHSVDVAVFKATGVLIGQLDPRARLVDLRGRRGVTAVPALATHIVRSRPDVVLSFMTAANGVAGLCEPIVRHLHRPVFVGSQRGWSSPVFGDMRTTLKGEIAYRAYRRGYRHLDGMVGVSEAVSQRVRASRLLSPDRVFTLCNPVIDAGSTIVSDVNSQEHHPWDITVVAVGRLEEAKDHLTLVRAISVLAPHHDIGLIIVGEGRQRGAVEAEALRLGVADRLRLTGYADPRPFLHSADLFALSSVREGLPNALIEAMNIGLPIVSTECPGGIGDLLDHGRLGRLVPVGDHQAFAAAIIDELLQPTGTAEDRRRVASGHTVERSTDEYLRLFDALELARS